MALTAANIISRVREVIMDDVTTYRHADADLLSLVEQADKDVCAKRPDLLIDDGTSTIPYALTSRTALSATSSTINVPDSMEMALVYFAASRAFLLDGASADNRAASRENYALYLNELQSA